MLSPLSGKEMILIEEGVIVDYKGVKVRTDFTTYFCELSGESFTTSELDEINMQRIKDEYDREIR